MIKFHISGMKDETCGKIIVGRVNENKLDIFQDEKKKLIVNWIFKAWTILLAKVTS